MGSAMRRRPGQLDNMPPEELTELSGFLFKVVRRISRTHEDAEDYVQETFLRTLRARDLVSLRAWACRVARMEATNELRKTGRRTNRLGRRINLDQVQTVENCFQELDQKELREAVSAAVARLPETEQAVIDLWVDGRTRSEIARELNFSESAVGRFYRRGIKRLRALLEACL